MVEGDAFVRSVRLESRHGRSCTLRRNRHIHSLEMFNLRHAEELLDPAQTDERLQSGLEDVRYDVEGEAEFVPDREGGEGCRGRELAVHQERGSVGPERDEDALRRARPMISRPSPPASERELTSIGEMLQIP